MRLSRHARNRLRLIAKRHPGITADWLLRGLSDARTLSYDDRGNRRARLRHGEVSIVVVIDEEAGLVVTIWVE